MNRTLNEIGEDMKTLESLLYDEELDFEDERVQAIVCDFADENEANFNQKIDNYAAFITEVKGRSSIRKTEAKRMNELAKIDENLAENLIKNLKYGLEQLGRKKVETDRYRVSVANNGGKIPLRVEKYAEELPKDCVKSKLVIDNDAIRAKLEAGESIDGCFLGERGTSLRIK